MKCCLFTLAMLVTTTLLAAEEDKSERSDKELIQGTWKVVVLEADGKKAPEDAFKRKRFLVEGDKISTSGKPEDLLPYRLDATAKPGAIDLPGSVNGQFAKAIYRLKLISGTDDIDSRGRSLVIVARSVQRRRISPAPIYAYGYSMPADPESLMRLGLA